MGSAAELTIQGVRRAWLLLRASRQHLVLPVLFCHLCSNLGHSLPQRREWRKHKKPPPGSQGLPKPAIGLCSPVLLHPSKLGHSSGFLPQKAPSYALTGFSSSFYRHLTAWTSVLAHLGAVRCVSPPTVVRCGSRKQPLPPTHVHCITVPPSTSALCPWLGEWGWYLISLPKEVEMVLKVTLISRNKGRTAWRALHTCFSQSNHTHLHPGNGFCCVQKPREEDV